MKRIFHHPPAPKSERRYWQSPAELADTPDFREALAREFPAGAAELEMDGVTRRSFLKLMGASTALAGLGLAACRRPEHKLLPFVKSSEWTIPGKNLFYASSMPRAGGAIPLIVTTVDGRPIKVDANPEHPASNGGSDMQVQASVLALYDPDRAKNFIRDKEQVQAEIFEKHLEKLLARHEGDGGAGMALLLEESNSPTRERLRKKVLQRFPQAMWAVYEPGGLSGAGAAFGPGVQESYNVANADVILTLDCDLLGTEDASGRYQRDFARRRGVKQDGGGKMNRLYAVENHYTITGGMADHRLRLPASHVGEFTRQLAAELGASAGGLEAAAGVTFPEGWIREAAKDLKAAGGRALVAVGPRQPAAVQRAALAINQALGGLGQTLEGQQSDVEPAATITDLAWQMGVKQVKTLFILGGNPAYNAPADLGWVKLQEAVPETIRLGLNYDETTSVSRWHVPAAHYLESWGDGLAADGSYLAMQPMILPLYDGWSENDLLSMLAGDGHPHGPARVQETFQERSGASGAAFDEAWNELLRTGFQKDSAGAPRALSLSGGRDEGAGNRKPLRPASADAVEVVLVPDYKLGYGSWANVSWLQETPDPVTKMTWDNVALMNQAMADRYEIEAPNGVLGGATAGDIIRIEVAGRSIEMPVLISPGHADHSITVTLGYGRRMIGSVASGSGVDAFPLLLSDSPYILTGAKITKTGGSYPLGVTQDHWSMEGRALIREGSKAKYDEHPEFAQKMWMDAENPDAGMESLYTNPPLDGAEQWGMTVDLNTCTGCNACVVACQAENNIPVVGKTQVMGGREMHWIRLDRYYATREGHEDDPEMISQPMMCQHCENAPCETVCPVNATVHNNEGLNVMAYNRCIGTRYCANNCPFKVRRFNFFDYNSRPIEQMQMGPIKAQGLYFGPLTEKGSPDTVKMQKNPNVTVRMRGVMEKCTFCLQRIEEAKITAKVRAGSSPDIRIPVDVFQVACQQACPSEAIVFGDLMNLDSKVSKLKGDARNYRLLDYLNVKARVSYLARIRNLNPAMPGAHEPAAYMEEEHGSPESHHGPNEPISQPAVEVGA